MKSQIAFALAHPVFDPERQIVMGWLVGEGLFARGQRNVPNGESSKYGMNRLCRRPAAVAPEFVPTARSASGCDGPLDPGDGS